MFMKRKSVEKSFHLTGVKLVKFENNLSIIPQIFGLKNLFFSISSTVI